MYSKPLRGLLYSKSKENRYINPLPLIISDRAKACEVGPHVSIAVVELGLVPYIKLLDFLA